MGNKDKLVFKRLYKDAVMPKYDNNGITINFYAYGNYKFDGYSRAISTGFKCIVPDGYVLEITSFPSKNGFIVSHTPVFKTSCNKDELKIHLSKNGGKYYTVEIKHGQPIAKGILRKVESLEIVEK